MVVLEVVRRHWASEPVGIALCAQPPLVLGSAVVRCMEDGTVPLVEATSNHVDQFGGSTGMTPPQQRERSVARSWQAQVGVGDVPHPSRPVPRGLAAARGLGVVQHGTPPPAERGA